METCLLVLHFPTGLSVIASLQSNCSEGSSSAAQCKSDSCLENAGDAPVSKPQEKLPYLLSSI